MTIYVIRPVNDCFAYERVLLPHFCIVAKSGLLQFNLCESRMRFLFLKRGKIPLKVVGGSSSRRGGCGILLSVPREVCIALKKLLGSLFTSHF